MPGGVFELRRDAITGWWVAVVVDRAYEAGRFAHRAQPLAGRECQNCSDARQTEPWIRTLRAHAFRVAGDERSGRDAAERPRGRGDRPLREEASRAGRDGTARDGTARDGTAHAGTREAQREGEPQPSLGLVADVGAWLTIVAPYGHHGTLAAEPRQIVIRMLELARRTIIDARARGGTEYVQVVENHGREAGALTNHLCLDLYDLPQIPHRIGEELGGSARYLIREGVCPYCRLVREEVASRERLVFEDAASVAFAPWASRSPFELWVVPRQHQADFSLASDAQLTGAAETLQKVLRLLDALDGPPYNLVLHTSPLHQRVDETYHWHWEIHPRLREIAGLELGTGLPVNPVSPEQAVAELRGRAGLDRVEWPA
jgi:UDPglucose--hexose-1-phosphate uridylyltransferase